MNPIRVRRLVAGFLLVVAALVTRNQVRVYQGRQARAADALMRELTATGAHVRAAMAADARARQIAPKLSARQTLFELLQPVALTNCRLERFGEAHDGGYLMCANLLGGVRSGYSYGISGYDKWGCDISSWLGIPVHQYDCFDTSRPACPRGDTIFHPECVAGSRKVEDGRSFDTIERQVARNGDAGGHIVLKIDVEGAEWDSFLRAPDELLARIDQLTVEFHQVAEDDEAYLLVVQRLRRFFDVAHVHFNNFSCVEHLDPFPTWAYEVLFVNKRLGVADPSRPVRLPHRLDAPNNPSAPECQR